MRDLVNNIHPISAAPPPATALADNTATVTGIIDTIGFDSLTFVIHAGTLVDADATFAVTVAHGDDSGLADSTPCVAATDLIGLGGNPATPLDALQLAAFDFSADNKTRKVGYRGNKRYVRLTVTPTNNTGAAPLAITAILGHPHLKPTPNPPS